MASLSHWSSTSVYSTMPSCTIIGDSRYFFSHISTVYALRCVPPWHPCCSPLVLLSCSQWTASAVSVSLSSSPPPWWLSPCCHVTLHHSPPDQRHQPATITPTHTLHCSLQLLSSDMITVNLGSPNTTVPIQTSRQKIRIFFRTFPNLRCQNSPVAEGVPVCKKCEGSFSSYSRNRTCAIKEKWE